MKPTKPATPKSTDMPVETVDAPPVKGEMGGLIAADVLADFTLGTTDAAEPVPAALTGLGEDVYAGDSGEAPILPAGAAGAAGASIGPGTGDGMALPPGDDPGGLAPPEAGLIGAEAGGTGAPVATGADATGELAGAAGATAGVVDGLGLPAGAPEIAAG